MNLGIGVPNNPSGDIRVADELAAYQECLLVRVEEALDNYAVILLDRLYDLTPQKTGETARSWEVFHSGAWEIFITNSNEPVSTFLSEGTVGHWVEPVTTQALHWVMDGIDYFSKGHMVTGITPLFIEWNALESTREELIQLLDQAENLAFDDAFEKGSKVSISEVGGGEELGGGDSDEGSMETVEGESGD